MTTTRFSAPANSPAGFSRRMLWAVAPALVLCASSPALAQKKSDEPEKPSKSYTLPYFFSGLAVLMVVVPLCFPSLRKTEAPKNEDD